MKLSRIPLSIVSLAVAYVMYGAMKNSRPPEEAHQRAAMEVVENIMDKIFTEKVKIPETSKRLADYISATLIPEVSAKIAEQQIDFTDLDILSLGNVTGADGVDHIVSLGLFGNVYTFNEDEMYKIVMEKIKASGEYEDFFQDDAADNGQK